MAVAWRASRCLVSCFETYIMGSLQDSCEGFLDTPSGRDEILPRTSNSETEWEGSCPDGRCIGWHDVLHGVSAHASQTRLGSILGVGVYGRILRGELPKRKLSGPGRRLHIASMGFSACGLVCKSFFELSCCFFIIALHHLLYCSNRFEYL